MNFIIIVNNLIAGVYVIIYSQYGMQIFFGNKETSFVPGQVSGTELLFISETKKLLDLQNIVLLRQTHGTQGYVITNVQEFSPYRHEGDYLITDIPRIGLGIATADCLPIIFYDKVKKIIASAHAGWKGSVARISERVVLDMQKVYGTKVCDIEVFFGPAAGMCCYEVSKEFFEHFTPQERSLVISEKGDKYYCDLTLYNKLRLQKLGVLSAAFNTDYNTCTICNTQFCSYRREKNSERQITIVSLC